MVCTPASVEYFFGIQPQMTQIFTNWDSQSDIFITTKKKKEDTEDTKLDVDGALCPQCPLFSPL